MVFIALHKPVAVEFSISQHAPVEEKQLEVAQG
jgi:hypothetical protein